jgi:uncharacterized protein YbjT (DUF2867 family)
MNPSLTQFLETLASLPVVPIFSARPSIQPIEVNEVALGILRLATSREPRQRVFELGAVIPMTLEDIV